MLFLEGQMKLRNRTGGSADACLGRLAQALGERYSEVHADGGGISARATGFEMVARGPRTHPMLPFEAAQFLIQSGDGGPQLAYKLSRKMQLLVFAGLCAATAFIALLVPSASSGALAALVVFAVVGAFNSVIATQRARSWIADFCASP